MRRRARSIMVFLVAGLLLMLAVRFGKENLLTFESVPFHKEDEQPTEIERQGSKLFLHIQQKDEGGVACENNCQQSNSAQPPSSIDEYNQKNLKEIKVFVYSLPSKFNKDIMDEIMSRYSNQCMNYSYFGFGKHLYQEGDMDVYYTNQFSLEVIMYHQLLHSRYRTLDPEAADVFYIPSYLTLLVGTHPTKLHSLQDELLAYMATMPAFQVAKPHISSVARIEREAEVDHPMASRVTYLVIEREALMDNRKYFRLLNNRVVVVPYPSYVHRNRTFSSIQEIQSPSLDNRKVFLFFAGTSWRGDEFRRMCTDQFRSKLEGLSADAYLSRNFFDDMVMLVTEDCVSDHVNITIKWMQNSVFCLQPHGDSPTRKSFFDSIQGGCIPVIFTFDQEYVEYPFQRVLKYSDFVVKIDGSLLTKNSQRNVLYNFLKNIPLEEVSRLHRNVLKVARMLQYSHPLTQPNSHRHVDALDMIMQELSHIFNI